MFENFQTWCRRCISSATSRIAGWLRRKKPRPRGKWLSGQHRSSSGLLFFAPMISPARDYRLYFPVDYLQDERLPLIVMLHGCKQDAASFAAGTRSCQSLSLLELVRSVEQPSERRSRDYCKHGARHCERTQCRSLAHLRRGYVRGWCARERAGELSSRVIRGERRSFRLDVSSGEFTGGSAVGNAARF